MDLRLRRRILLFLTLVCSAAGAFADNTYHQKETDDYVTLGDLTVEPGSNEEYQLTVNLNGTQIYTAFEMDIELPSGLEPVMVKDSKGVMRPKVWLWMGENTVFFLLKVQDIIFPPIPWLHPTERLARIFSECRAIVVQ